MRTTTQNKKNKKSKWILVGALALLMIFTTAMAFAFWSSGINGATHDGRVLVNIGEGDELTTTIQLSEVNLTGRLIPRSVPIRAADEVHYFRFGVDVTWTALQNIQIADPDYTGDGPAPMITVAQPTYADIAGIAATLTTQAMQLNFGTGDNAVDLLNATGLVNPANAADVDNGQLFRVVVDAPMAILGSAIGGTQNLARVYITIDMPSRPANRAQYNQVAGQTAELVLNFTVGNVLLDGPMAPSAPDA